MQGTGMKGILTEHVDENVLKAVRVCRGDWRKRGGDGRLGKLKCMGGQPGKKETEV